MNRHQTPPQRQSWFPSGLLLITLLSSLIISPSALGQVLEVGSRGDEVRRVQSRLKQLGYFNSAIDGIYSNDTIQAVILFQDNCGLEVDGKVGQNTRTLLFNRECYARPNTNIVRIPDTPNPAVTTSTSNVNSTTAEVRQLQQRLRDLGYRPLTVDGIYGSETAAAVSAFQQRNNLEVDGVAGRQTFAALFSDRAIAARQDRNNRNNNDNSDRSYVVVIPEPKPNDLEVVKGRFSDASLQSSRRGMYIRAGAFAQYEVAEARAYILRGLGFDARVVYF
jgi:peptidoglycan hydrolase-like protein with peptidoglycan-binding domain